VWAIVAATLIGTSFRIGSANQFGSSKSNFKNTKTSKSRLDLKSDFNQNLDRNLDRLSVTNDEQSKDRTIISPRILAQQPQQFKGLMCLVLSLFVWTILDLPEGIAELGAIALVTKLQWCRACKLSAIQTIATVVQRQV